MKGHSAAAGRLAAAGGRRVPVCTCGEAAALARQREVPPPPPETQGRAKLSRPPSPAQLLALGWEAGLRGWWPELRARRAQGGDDSGVDVGGNNGLNRRGR